MGPLTKSIKFRLQPKVSSLGSLRNGSRRSRAKAALKQFFFLTKLFGKLKRNVTIKKGTKEKPLNQIGFIKLQNIYLPLHSKVEKGVLTNQGVCLLNNLSNQVAVVLECVL